jgi:hypothetical protein
MKLGYARVWASDQDASLQRDALKLFSEVDLDAATAKANYVRDAAPAHQNAALR